MVNEETAARLVERFRSTFEGTGLHPEEHLAECPSLRVGSGDADPDLDRFAVLIRCDHRAIGWSTVETEGAS